MGITYRKCQICGKQNEYEEVSIGDERWEQRVNNYCGCIKSKKINIDEVFNKTKKLLESEDYRMDNLPKIIGQLDKDLIKNLFVDKSRRKIELDMAYLLSVKAQNPEVPVTDFVNFIHKAQVFGADPVKNQVYLIPFKTKQGQQWVSRGNTIFSYQFFISKAEESGQFDGWDIDTKTDMYFNPETGEENKTLVSIATIYRKDRTHPVVYEAWYPEFVKKKEQWVNGRATGLFAPTEQWKKPKMMLPKCSLCNGLRQAFPEDLGGLSSEYDRRDEVEESKTVDLKSDNDIETESYTVRDNPEPEEKTDQQENPEQVTPNDDVRLVTDNQLKRLFAIVKGKDAWEMTNVKETIKMIWNIDSTKDLNRTQYNWIIGKIETITPRAVCDQWVKSQKENNK